VISCQLRRERMEKNNRRRDVVAWAKATVKATVSRTEPSEENPSGRWLDQTIRTEDSDGHETEKRVVEPIDPA
jgi:hypothetical protein